MSLPSTVTWASMAAQPPAYTAVPMRTTFAPPAPAPAEIPTPPTDKPKKVVWSPPVKLYVQRALADENQIDGISPKDVHIQLRKTISYFAERNIQDEVDWPTYPLPQHIILAERRNAGQNVGLGAGTPQFTGTNNTSPLGLSKRKSQDVDELDRPTKKSTPPWAKANLLADRITFGKGQDKRQKQEEPNSNQSDLERRRQRFQLGSPGRKTTPPWRSSQPEPDRKGPVVGTNQSLEKSYFRLTAAPKADTVRPQHILEKTLDMLCQKWKSEEKNYNYICNQFKSLRQDLTVQHIKNPFTVKVYEVHARIALEKGDLGEYNQCQTQLRALYKENLGGHPAEFLAYRILYFVYTCNKADMNDLLAELTIADKTQEAVKHALDVRSALALGNYHKFFKLYEEAPNMGPYLMDMFVERERLAALANISKAYFFITIRFLAQELGFENEDECLTFLKSINVEHLFEEKADDKNGKHLRLNLRGSSEVFNKLRSQAFATVDIKGQI